MLAFKQTEISEVVVYRIGEFSKICRVSVSALRYYGDLGLLPPDTVDPETGYRYYSVSQLPRLNRILALKDLGLSLDEIAAILNEELSATELRGMLRLKKSEISQTVTKDQERLSRVEHRLRLIEGEGTMPDNEVVLRELNSQWVLSLRESMPGFQEIGILIGDGFSALIPAGIMPSAPAFTVYHDPEFKTVDVDVEVAFPVEGPVEDAPNTPGGRSFLQRKVARGKAAVLIHEGPYDTIGNSYELIGRWMSENELHIAGSVREAYLVGPDDPNGPITEIRIPVE